MGVQVTCVWENIDECGVGGGGDNGGAGDDETLIPHLSLFFL